MKMLNKLVKLEMSNIHFFKPSKNVVIKEFLFMSILFGLVGIYGIVFMSRIDDVWLREKSILVVFLLAGIAAIYDFGTRMKSLLYDYNQFKMLSYLPVDLSHIISAKFISMIAMTCRWMLMIGFSFSLVYVAFLQKPPEYLLTCFMLLINGSLIIPILGVWLLSLFLKSKWLGMVGIALECIPVGVIIYVIYNCFTSSSALNQILSKPVWAVVIMISQVVILGALVCFVKSDYRERLVQIEWKDGYGKQSRAEISSNSIFQSLYSKEKKAFYSFKLYMVNTMAPVVIFSLLILALCFVPQELIKKVLLETGYEKEVLALIPILLCFVFGMSNPTYCSISLEGKAMEVLKSKPLYFKDLLIAKIRVYLSCILPFVIVDSIMLGYAVNKRLNVTDILLSVLFSLIFVVVIGIVGILLDVLLGNIEWVNQVSVVKQSITMPLQMLACGILVGIPSGMEMGFHLEKNSLYFLVAAIWGGIGILLYALTKKVAKRKLGF